MVIGAATAFHRQSGFTASSRFLLVIGAWEVSFTSLALPFAPRGRPVGLTYILQHWHPLDGDMPVSVTVPAVLIALGVLVAHAGLIAANMLARAQVRWLRRIYAGNDERYVIVCQSELADIALPGAGDEDFADAAIVLRLPTSSGAYRGTEVRWPVGRCHLDAAQTLSPLRRRARITATLLAIQIASVLSVIGTRIMS